jgi:hypothetical protein
MFDAIVSFECVKPILFVVVIVVIFIGVLWIGQDLRIPFGMQNIEMDIMGGDIRIHIRTRENFDQIFVGMRLFLDFVRVLNNDIGECYIPILFLFLVFLTEFPRQDSINPLTQNTTLRIVAATHPKRELQPSQ